ncbi:hypothetical protein GCM10009603_50950 [Nocardiopsis exhalans]
MVRLFGGRRAGGGRAEGGPRAGSEGAGGQLGRSEQAVKERDQKKEKGPGYPRMPFRGRHYQCHRASLWTTRWRNVSRGASGATLAPWVGSVVCVSFGIADPASGNDTRGLRVIS